MSLPDGLLAELDAEVKRRGTSRSALLTDAARRELARRDPAGLAAAIERSERRFRSAGSFESADVVRADRGDHARSELDAHVLDLAICQVGNVRARGAGAAVLA